MSSATSSIHSTTSAAQCGTRYYSGGLSEVLRLRITARCSAGNFTETHPNFVLMQLLWHLILWRKYVFTKGCFHKIIVLDLDFISSPCWFMTVPQEIFLNSCRWNNALDFHTCGLCAFPYLRKTDKAGSAVTYLIVCLTFMMPHNVHIVCSGDIAHYANQE